MQVDRQLEQRVLQDEQLMAFDAELVTEDLWIALESNVKEAIAGGRWLDVGGGAGALRIAFSMPSRC